MGLEKGISSTAITLPYSSACARIRLDELWPTLFMAELLISSKLAKTGCFAPAQFLLTEARDRCLCWYPTCTVQYNTVNSLEVYCPIITRIGVSAQGEFIPQVKRVAKNELMGPSMSGGSIYRYTVSGKH